MLLVGRFAFVANVFMPFTFTHATARVQAGVCGGGDCLHSDIQAGLGS
jgi:hypothetical protein